MACRQVPPPSHLVRAAYVRRTVFRVDPPVWPADQAAAVDADRSRPGACWSGRCPHDELLRRVHEPQRGAAARRSVARPRGFGPEVPAPRMVGVDEYATRNGRYYRTVPACPRTLDGSQDVDQGLGNGVGQRPVHGHQGGIPVGHGSRFRPSHHIPLASHSVNPVVGGVTTALFIAWMKRKPQLGVESRA